MENEPLRDPSLQDVMPTPTTQAHDEAVALLATLHADLARYPDLPVTIVLAEYGIFKRASDLRYELLECSLELRNGDTLNREDAIEWAHNIMLDCANYALRAIHLRNEVCALGGVYSAEAAAELKDLADALYSWVVDLARLVIAA